MTCCVRVKQTNFLHSSATSLSQKKCVHIYSCKQHHSFTDVGLQAPVLERKQVIIHSERMDCSTCKQETNGTSKESVSF